MPKKKRGVSLVGLIFVFIAFIVMAISIQNLNTTDISLVMNLTDENSISETELNNKEVSATTKNIVDHYYYDQIGEGSQIMYNSIMENIGTLKAGSGTIDFPNNEVLVDKDFQTAWDAFKLDHPEIFYVDTSQLSLVTQKTSYLFINKTFYKYSLSEKEGGYYIKSFKTSEDIDSAEIAIDSVTKSILAGANGSRYNKIKYAHDWIVDHCEYNKSDEDTNDSIYGVLVKKKAVCEGYANAFKYLMDKMNIPCVIVYGTATNSSGETEAHAWNYVQLENEKWYLVDTTWDDPIIYGGGSLNDESKYKYFLVGADAVSENHVEDNDVSGTGQHFTYPELSKANY